MSPVFKVLVAVTLMAVVSGAASQPAAADASEFRITRQPSILYLQEVLMEEKKLIEKHAAALGVKDLKVSWVNITSGGVATEALLSGSVDVVTSGVSNMLLLWDRTQGGVKGIVGVAGLPMLLVTRNPAIKTIKDFGPSDRIALPTIKVSMQATILGIELEKVYGQGNHNKLESIQVQIGHPDATQALLNPNHEINSHFSAPPFQNIALRSPGVHAVLNSVDVLGGPATVTVAFGTQKFVDANPLIIKAFIAAFDEASGMIAQDPKAAAEVYLAATREKVALDELVGMIRQPGAIFSAVPQRTMLYADYMARVGLLKRKPTDWRDIFFAPVHDRAGS
jgi:NitT/TauT family transport system substrate-binding protein